MTMQRAEMEAELRRLLRDELAAEQRYDSLSSYSPYPRQREFHDAGRNHRERLLSAGNQLGKTLCASMETAMHATGIYPTWWSGWRFDRPTIGLVCGQSWQLSRDNIQRMLLGTTDLRDAEALGTGSIPRGALLLDSIISAPVQGAVAQFRVKHASGGISTIHVIPYLAGRSAIQSYTADFVWCDEEPPESFYLEALTRTNVRMGPVFVTFTPLLGMSAVARRFFQPSDGAKDRALIRMTLLDAGHYSAAQADAIERSYPPHERDARCRGIPKLGAGAIYPLAREEIEVKPFAIPDHWPRVFGLDVGWNRTAAVWGAVNRESDTLYIYHEYYGSQSPPAVHAAAIKAPGAWIPGVIDPASRGRSQIDGTNLMDEYRKLGLNLLPADNSRESGLYAVWDRLSTGRLKIFSTCENWFAEQATYRRDENGKVVKEYDHLMDATRYMVMSGVTVARYKPGSKKSNPGRARGIDSWMSA